MTINKRQYVDGLVETFDPAAGARNREQMIAILNQVGVRDAAASAGAILAEPARYVY
jgi:hypothetical protein